MNSPNANVFNYFRGGGSSDSKQYKTPNVSKSVSHFSSANYTMSSPGVKETLADRFIPLRTRANLYEKFLAEDSPTEAKKNKPETFILEGIVEEKKENAKKYEALLKANMIAEELPKSRMKADSISEEPVKDFSGSVFTFKKEEIKADIPIDLDLNPITKLGQEFLYSSECNTSRKLPRSPYKILDAPGLKNDFYLNIIDWSSTDILAVGLNRTLYTLSANLSKVDLVLKTTKEITALSFNPNGKYLFLGYSDGLTQIMDMETLKVVVSYSGHLRRVTCGSWCNRYLFSTGSQDKVILDRDIRTASPFIRFHEGHKQEVCSIKWNNDGRFLASGGNDNKVLLWDLKHTSPLLTLSGHSAAIKAIGWNPVNGNLLTTGGGTTDRSIKTWDCVDNKCLRAVDTGSQVCNILFSKDGKELVSAHGYMSNAISVWNSSNLARIGAFLGHYNRVLHLAMSPDGESVVTGAGDETLKFWKLFQSTNGSKEQYKSSLSLSCMELR